MSYYQKRRLLAKVRRIIDNLSHRQQPTDWDAIYLMDRIRCQVENEPCWFVYAGKKYNYKSEAAR
jgi:hypothetical protein